MSTERKYNVTSDDLNFDTDAFIDGMAAQPLTIHTPEFYDGQTHCVVNGSIVSIASLTAAAPEMLEALEALLESAMQSEYLVHNEMCSRAEKDEILEKGWFSDPIYQAIAAIAKAKGEQP